MNSEIVVPLIHKSRPIGALNILSRNHDQFTLRRRGDRAAVRVARRRRARERAAVRAQRAGTPTRSRRSRRSAAKSRRSSTSTSCSRGSRSSPSGVIDYRTFGILLLNDDGELEMKLAVQYGEKVDVPRVQARGRPRRVRRAPPGSRCSSPTCSQDPRYIKLVPDVRSELAIPLLLKDRCIGVIDLESPELDAFSQARRRDPDAARQPGGRGDRERAAVRRRSARTRSGWRRSCGSRSACRRRCCRRGRRSG